MAAALLTDEPVILRDIPDLSDIRNMCRLLESLGCSCQWSKDDTGVNVLKLHAGDASKVLAHYDIVRTMRAGICVLGPLIAARGKAKVSMPGGCAIGDRPVDLHLRGLRGMGAGITLEEGYIVAEAPGGRRGQLHGGRVFMGGPFGSTVLGTDNILCAAVLADGTTIIECAACEPEVVDLAEMLIAMGARIHGAGGPRIIVEGVSALHGVDYTVMADRIEAGTYLMASAITNGEITLENCPTDALTAVLDRLAEIGVEVEDLAVPTTALPPHITPTTPPVPPTNSHQPPRHSPQSENGIAASTALLDNRLRQTVRVSAARRLQPVQVVTQPHPGFPTDLQAQIMALLCLADGNSVVTEKIFPDRFMHVAELLRMGASLIRNGASVLVSGTNRLVGAPVMASDLRASAGLVLAGLAAKGVTTVNRVYHLDRGYERMELTLQALGADIERVDVKGS